MAFNPWGLLFTLLAVLPSMLMLFFPATDSSKPGQENASLMLIERIGQIALTILPSLTYAPSPVNALLYAALAIALINAGLWARFYLKGRAYTLLYAPLWILPVPMAILPTACFFLFGLWAQSVLVCVCALFFAIGHIPLSLQKAKRS